MGFFKDFKADLSQAVNELSDDASKLADVSAEKVEEPVPDDDVMVDTLANDMQSDAGDSDIEESLTRALADIKADDKKPESAARKTTAKAVKEEEKSVQAKETAEETLVTAGADEISDETAIITRVFQFRVMLHQQVLLNFSVRLKAMLHVKESSL